MMKPSTSVPETLRYLDMIREFRREAPLTPSGEIRLALLGDFATQQLAPLLHVLCRRRNLTLRLYEAPYDSIDTEILDPHAALYAFRPDYIVLLPAGQNLKAKLYAAKDRQAFVSETVDRWKNLWAALQLHSSATVIQGNYAVPAERAYGHYERKIKTSIGSAFAELNHGLGSAIREAQHVLPCDIDHLAGNIGRRIWYDVRLWSMAKGFCHLDHLPQVAKAVCDIAFAARGHGV